MMKTVKTVKKKQARQTAAKETEEISKKTWNPKTHRREEKYTQKRETTTERSEQMQKNVSETKKD